MPYRVRLFVDFWNLELNWRGLVKKTVPDECRLPWRDAFPEVICREVARLAGDSTQYAGTQVFASAIEDQADLRRFLHVMDGFPGYEVETRLRRKYKREIHCPACGKMHSTCPHCNAVLKEAKEKGVDVALATALIQKAFDKTFDIAVLASMDKDLSRAVEFVQERTDCKVFHLSFPHGGNELRNACWNHIDIRRLMKDLGVNAGTHDSDLDAPDEEEPATP